MFSILRNKLWRRQARQSRLCNCSTRPLTFEQLETRICRSTINVIAFGAVGDDELPDTDAIQAAVAAAKPGDKVLFPSGIYHLDKTVVIANTNITLTGSGRTTVIQAHIPSFNLFYVTSDKVTFARLAFQGAETQDTTVENMGHFGHFAIYTDLASTASKGTVRDCYFTGPNPMSGLNNGIKLETGSDNWTVKGNFFERLIGTVSGTGYGILVGASTGHQFKGNRFVGGLGQGRHAIYLSAGASDSRVSNNIIEGFNEASIAVYARNYQLPCRSNMIRSNTIIDQGRGSTGSGAIELDGNVQSNVVKGNVIKRPGRHGIVVAAVNEGDLARNNTITGNRIYEAGQFGILLDGATMTTVSRNSVFDASLSSPGTYSAIQVQADGFSNKPDRGADRNVIERNLIAGMGGSVHYRWGIILNETSPAPTNTSVLKNRVARGMYGAIDVAVASLPTTLIKGNVVSQPK